MSPSALPLISEPDYPGFQRMISELMQVSYEEWRYDHLKAVAYRRNRNGSREIAITPEEFDRWLKENELAAHLELLWACIEEKAQQPSQPAPARALSS